MIKVPKAITAINIEIVLQTIDIKPWDKAGAKCVLILTQGLSIALVDKSKVREGDWIGPR